MTEIPFLPEMRSIQLGDRVLIAEIIQAQNPHQSELTFTNLFVWRNAYQLHLCQIDDAIAVFAWRADPEDSFLLPPLGEKADSRVVETCLSHLDANGHAPIMARVTKQDINRLGIAEKEFTIEPDRDHWDYVYAVRDLVELSGNKYHRKRNHIEQFNNTYESRYVRLTPERVSACRELQDRWCDEKHCDLVTTLRAEAKAVKEVLENIETLRVVGGCIEIDGNVEAFTLGEMLNDETVVIHIEKANAAFHGLYQVINQQFLKNEWDKIRYVNREQDMGVPGLRKAKESYYPDHMVEKFNVRLK